MQLEAGNTYYSKSEVNTQNETPRGCNEEKRTKNSFIVSFLDAMPKPALC